jgi:anti-sigma B factor antagonist
VIFGGDSSMPDGPAMTAALHQVGDDVVVEVVGEVDLLTAPPLQQTIFAALEGHPPVVVIDLLAVTFLGSAGLAVLVEAQRRAGAWSEIRLVASGPVTVRPLRAIGLADAFPIFDSRAAALNPSSPGNGQGS